MESWRVHRLGLVGVVVLALVVAGCTQGSSDAPAGGSPSKSAEVPKAIAPIVDRETGNLAPGSSRFGANDYYAYLLAAVQSDVQDTCMKDGGYKGPLTSFDPPSEMYKVEVSLSPWLEEHAALYGFFPPQPLGDLMGNGIAPETFSEQEVKDQAAKAKRRTEEYIAFQDQLESPEYQGALGACESDPEVTKWANLDIDAKSSGPWLEEFQAGWIAAFKDEDMREIKADYVACLEDNDLAATDPESIAYEDMFEVQGQSYEVIDEQQVRLAVQVVACKDQTQASERMMTVWSQYEAGTYLEYEQELIEARDYIEGIKAELDEYLVTRER